MISATPNRSNAEAIRRTEPQPSGVADPAVKPVAIDELRERYGWAEGEWQDRLLQAADGAGTSDGNVTVGELDAYLAAPEDLQFVTSKPLVEAMETLRAEGGERAVDGFDEGFGRQLATEADRLGNEDGKLDEGELETFIGQLKENSGKPLPSWFPEQQQAVFASKVAEFTGEVDHLKPGGETTDGVQIVHDYMRAATDDQLRVPPWVSHVVTGADLEIKGLNEKIMRPKIGFRQDTEQPGVKVTDGEYTLLNKQLGTKEDPHPVDRGHMRDAESSANIEAMYESFLTTNIAPQYGNLNQGAWRFLEDGTRQLVEATGGKATVFTGNLFLDPKTGEPIPKDEVELLATKRGAALPIPTHSFKTVLVETPDGQQQMFAYIIPNERTMGKKVEDSQQGLAEDGWRVSVDDVEKLIGYDLYSQLPAEVQARLEADPAARAELVVGSEFKMANLFMGDGSYVMSES